MNYLIWTPIRKPSRSIPRTYAFSISGLATFMIWNSFLLMMIHPISLAPAIRLYDVFAVIAILFGIVLMAKKKLYSTPLRSYVFFSFLFYVGSIIFFSLLGQIFLPQAQLWMSIGDLRWVSIFFIVVIAASIYRVQRYGLLQRDLLIMWVIVVIVTWAVLLSQILLQLKIVTIPWILELWYPEGYKNYGFHIFRFSGPLGSISGLATFGTVTFIAAFLTANKSKLIMFVMISALFFILASGSRTAIVINGVFLFLYFFRFIFYIFINISRSGARFYFNKSQLFLIGSIVTGLVAIYWASTEYNIGRFNSGLRLHSIYSFFLNDATLFEVAGRGGDRWNLPIIESKSWSPIGTLVSSAHAINLPAFDSYYVLMWAQAGPFIAFFFLSMIVTTLFLALKNFRKSRNFANGLAIAIIMCLPIFGLTQNMMTGLLGRSLLGIAVFIVMASMSRKSNRIPIDNIQT